MCDCALATDCVCHNVTAATYHADDDAVLCATPDWSGDGGGAPLRRERVYLSLNGQDFGATGFAFSRYKSPPRGAALLQLRPLAGPTAGGTLLRITPPDGLAGGSEYRCRFGDEAEAPASADADRQSVACAAPPAEAAGPVQLWLALNGQQFVPLGRAIADPGERFHYYAPVSVATLSPSGGPLRGSTTVTLSLTAAVGPPRRPPSLPLRPRHGPRLAWRRRATRVPLARRAAAWAPTFWGPPRRPGAGGRPRAAADRS